MFGNLVFLLACILIVWLGIGIGGIFLRHFKKWLDDIDDEKNKQIEDEKNKQIEGSYNMFGYLAAGFCGFMIGVIASCILLAKKNLEMAQKIGNNTVQNFKQNMDIAKAVCEAKSNDSNEIESETSDKDSK